MSKPRKVTITVEDLQFGFDSMRRGAAVFIDTQFKGQLADVLKKEYKCEPKDWQPMLKLWQDYNTALHGLYLTKAVEILNMGMGIMATVSAEEAPTKRKVAKKKKTKERKTESMMEMGLPLKDSSAKEKDVDIFGMSDTMEHGELAPAKKEEGEDSDSCSF